MTIDSIALWLGYGVMTIGGAILVVAALFFVALACANFSNVIGRNLRAGWDLSTLRDQMRQLEAEGKVKRKGSPIAGEVKE